MGLLVNVGVEPNQDDFKYHHLSPDQQYYLQKELEDIKNGVRPTPKIVKTYTAAGQEQQQQQQVVEVYEIEEILAKRETKCPTTFEYLVSWKGFPNEEDRSWLAYSGPDDLEWADDLPLVQAFEQTPYSLLPARCVHHHTPTISKKITLKKKGAAAIVVKKKKSPPSSSSCSKSSSFSPKLDKTRRLLFQ